MRNPSIGIVGGTGPQGKGLGYRFSRGGHQVILGSRSPDKASQAADEINSRTARNPAVSGCTNAKAVEKCDVVLIAIPWDGHAELLEELRQQLAGKIVISCVNPLGFDEQGPYGLEVPEGSAAEQAAALLPDSRVVGAFHHVSAGTLWSEKASAGHEDVLVCGDDQEAKRVTQEIARVVTGRPGVDVGPLRLARQLEPLTAVLISINSRHKVRSGISIAGLPEAKRSA